MTGFAGYRVPERSLALRAGPIESRVNMSSKLDKVLAKMARNKIEKVECVVVSPGHQ